jgi:hypothetical protein
VVLAKYRRLWQPLPFLPPKHVKTYWKSQQARAASKYFEKFGMEKKKEPGSDFKMSSPKNLAKTLAFFC